jgi:hypothetical protein
VRAAPELLGARTFGGGSAWPGGGDGGSQKSNKSSKLPGMYENSAKTASFLHFFT